MINWKISQNLSIKCRQQKEYNLKLKPISNEFNRQID